jgi:hypothetical protein
VGDATLLSQSCPAGQEPPHVVSHTHWPHWGELVLEMHTRPGALQPPRQEVSQMHWPVVVSHTSVGPQPPQQELSATHTPELVLHVLQTTGAHRPAPALAQASQRQPLMAPHVVTSAPAAQLTLQLPPTPQVGSARQNPQVVEAGLLSQRVPCGQDPPQVGSHTQVPQFATSATSVLHLEPAGQPPEPPQVVSQEHLPVVESHFSPGPHLPQQVASGLQRPTLLSQSLHATGAHPPALPLSQGAQRQPD